MFNLLIKWDWLGFQNIEPFSKINQMREKYFQAIWIIEQRAIACHMKPNGEPYCILITHLCDC